MRRIRLQAGQLPFELPQIQDFSKPVVELHKNGRYLLFKAIDIASADILRDLMERMACNRMRELEYWGVKAEDPGQPVVADWHKVELWKHLDGDIARHPLCQILKANGVEISTVPTLENYIRKEFGKQQIENTPFPMPAVSGDTSLFQRCQVGMNLLCIKDFSEPDAGGRTYKVFEKGKHYLVVSVGGSGNDIVRISTQQLSDNLVMQDVQGSFAWSVFHPEMEQHFDDSEETDLGPTVEEAYPELIAMNRKAIDKIGYPIYDHGKIDAAMAATKRGFLNCSAMRMGKTRTSIAVAEIWGSKKIAILGSENVRLVWEKEFKKVGITDYVMVDSVYDLQKPGRFYLIKYGWARKKSDPTDLERRRYSNYLHPSERVVSRAVAWTPKSQQITVYQHNPCPHCGEPMERPHLRRDKGGPVKLTWVRSEGYMCRNKKCVWTTDNRKIKGAAWGGKLIQHKPGTYVDTGLAGHSKCEYSAVRGRRCNECGETDGVWVPQVTKRFKKYFTVVIADEIHHVKDRSTQTAEAVYRLRARRKMGLTGTLLSNSAMDAYWIMSWVIGGPSECFPYLHKQGMKEFEDRFCEHAILEKPTGQKDEETGEEIKKTIRRRLPYFKNAPDWWRFAAPKVLRRNYKDPLYLKSLAESGMQMPDCGPPQILRVPMTQEQVKLMLSALKDFKDVYQKAMEEAKVKNQDLNGQFIMSQMTAMRIVATIPSFINKRFDKDIYTGIPGGGKMYHIATITKDRILNGGKVVILTDFVEMQKAVEAELKDYGVIRFDTSWDIDQRREALDRFNEDDEIKILVAGTRAVSESLDFSVANTCICCDILWAPGDQAQAWSRILTPTDRERKCEIFIVLSENSIDEHMYSVFYSKLMMSEQGMDRRSVNRRAVEINYSWFAERVIQEEANLTLQLRESDSNSVILVDVNEGLMEDRPE